MVKPSSMDWREQAAVLTGGMSARKAAARFGVSESSAIKWVRRHRQTGSAAPSQIGRYKPRLLARCVIGLSHVPLATLRFVDLLPSFRNRCEVPTVWGGTLP
jgi:helix-turn-helix, Psq domain